MKPEILQRYIEGNASMTEKQEVLEWLNRDEKNMREYLSIRKLYTITLWHNNEESVANNNEQARSKGHLFIREILKMTAIFTIVLVGALYWLRIKNDGLAKEMQTIHVPAGQRAELLLADGTKVWLNAQTTLTFPVNFASEIRKVKLDGEGYFIVAKDKKKPFIVETTKYDVKVLGTEFNVIAYASSPMFETTLLHGSVEVFSPNSSQQIILEPNTKAALVNGTLQKSTTNEFNHFLWREGIISFQDESVEDMMKNLKLYYDVDIIVTNLNLMRSRYTGKFRTKDGIEHILRVLQLSNKFSYKKDDDKNIIYIN